MNLPNKLTILRILLIPVFVFFLMFDNSSIRIIPLIIFIAASLTDTLDGNIARKYNLITDFGKFMDPLADKLLVSSALMCFVEMNYISAWIVIIIIGREFLISGFRTLAASKNVTIAANKWGKIKTVFQMVLIIVILLDYARPIQLINKLINPLIIITVLLTLISAITYLVNNRNVIES